MAEIDRRKIEPKILEALGWEIVCLLEDFEDGYGSGLVELQASDGIPYIVLEIRRVRPRKELVGVNVPPTPKRRFWQWPQGFRDA